MFKDFVLPFVLCEASTQLTPRRRCAPDPLQMVAPVQKKRIVKKRTLRFTRMQSDRVAHIKPSWRKPKGIDCVVRRRFKDIWRCPKIGYGSNKKVCVRPWQFVSWLFRLAAMVAYGARCRVLQ